MVLVGNKCDMEMDREVSRDQVSRSKFMGKGRKEGMAGEARSGKTKSA